MTERGIQPIVMHGALLGHHLCDRQLLPWEDNINLILPIHDFLRLIDCPHSVNSASFFFDVNPNYISRKTLNLHPSQNLEPNTKDARFIDRATGLYIDVAAAMMEDDSLATKSSHRWKHDDIHPLQYGVLMDEHVHLPRNIPVVLRNEYGDLARIAREVLVIKHLRSLRDQEPAKSAGHHGRGIVTTASDKYVPFLRVLLDSLQRHGCRLPIEIWHRLGEISGEYVAELSSAQVKLRVFDSAKEPKHGFACKPAAIIASSLSEVLFLDADNSVLSDPAFMFDQPEYVPTGAVLWPDQAYTLRREPEFRRMLELSPAFTPVDSGQLLIDKHRHLHGIQIIDELNRNSQLTYRFTYGDKDTFTMGFEMAGESYHLHPIRPQRLQDCSFLHTSSDGEPAFRHRSAGGAKFI